MRQFKPAVVDWTVYQGSDFYRTITINDPANGGPFDIRDELGDIIWTARMDVGTSYDAETASLQLTSDVGGGLTISATDDQTAIVLHMTASQTASLPKTKDRLVFDLEIENTVTGQVIRLLQGKIFVDPERTK